MHICHRHQPPKLTTEADSPGGHNPAAGPLDRRPQHDCLAGFSLDISEGFHDSATDGLHTPDRISKAALSAIVDTAK